MLNKISVIIRYDFFFLLLVYNILEGKLIICCSLYSRTYLDAMEDVPDGGGGTALEPLPLSTVSGLEAPGPALLG